ncbi:DUF3073 domain-containing protein [Kitasatospora purpeofusca]|uniref:DUF3073 domain-containing protein n=1 Tax=Streptomycetaceae TaxID=2062 RepID=UPI0004BEA340|nr:MULTISPECIES: DUF3073 domain-containing protein [Streptomycetaceae]KJY33618.1 hypothetical protein VR45_19190 [Streptomyces sp. NRRL S-495]KOV24920.1 hypothetical protein ADK60_23420 [Streptomyces sp. XY431]SDT71799.1 Protein of unknown function [Streptomyces sp. TLI_053]
MGRGRAKAKQTKVARELKYNSGGFDANRLSSELGVSPSTSPIEPEPIEEDEEDDDPYAEYAARYADDDEDDDAESGTGPSQARRRA